MMSTDILLLLGSYLVGAIPFGYLFTKLRTGADIREKGSGNIGATNVLRTQGPLWGALTLALDFGKAALAVNCCRYFGSAPWMIPAGGFAAVFGHCYPVYIGFRGGKGIASGFGAFIFISPAAAFCGVAVFSAVVGLTRLVALGSILGSLAFGASLFLLHAFWGWYDIPTCWAGLCVALLLVARHHKNIRNMIRKEEPRLGEKDRDSQGGVPETEQANG
ncbi:MAG: glycerol-3-phosphate 1-O-acyltransferase PlsY [Acidobacteria bacterium]|nr:glycerol-3-phosphate 1-O-acyltransferase PlsY [Acidobacteriota bacterium]